VLQLDRGHRGSALTDNIARQSFTCRPTPPTCSSDQPSAIYRRPVELGAGHGVTILNNYLGFGNNFGFTCLTPSWRWCA
jgi:hypothetical protein